MGPLIEWVSDAASKDFLQFTSVEGAMGLLKGTMGTYRYVNGIGAYENYPRMKISLSCVFCENSPSVHPVEKRIMGVSDFHHANTRKDIVAGMAASNSPTMPSSIHSDTKVNSEEPEQRAEQSGQTRANGSTEGRSDSQVSSLIEQTMKVLEIAKHDNTFMMLNLLFDEHIDSKFDYFAASYSEFVQNKMTMNQVIRNILNYSHMKHFGQKDTVEFKKLETILRSTLDVLASARRVLKLKAYEDMRWAFLSGN